MRFVVFGLTVSSSWGNGHATLWRGLCRALARMGHRVTFFEKDVPYYAAHRDLPAPRDFHLRLYPDWSEVASDAAVALRGAHVAMVTSYCPDALEATEMVLASPASVRCFYDMDTPVTLRRLQHGQRVDYLGPGGLTGFDLVLSFAGGAALQQLRERLGARAVAPLYGSADLQVHAPARRTDAAAVSHLGTYAADRAAALDALFFEPARRLPEVPFVLAGSLYPDTPPWPTNVRHLPHVAPPEHAACYGASAATVNVTRGPMVTLGHCPSGRLFEAAACETPILSDWWEGLDRFFDPDTEILVAGSADEAVAALSRPAETLARIGRAARQRVLAEHSAEARARQLVELVSP